MGGGIVRALSLAIALAVFWVLLSGYWLPLIIIFGIASIALTVYIAHRMDLTDREGHPIHVGARGLLHWPWLVKEIIASNIYVARRILSGNVDPQVIETRASQSDALGHVTYANWITLTPGTVSIGVREGEITVHALTPDTADGVLSDEMNARVCAFMGDPKPAPPAAGDAA